MWGDIMISYGIQCGTVEPPAIFCTETSVFEARNITPYTETIDDRIITGYKYEYYQYTKDEYIKKLAEDNKQMQQDLIDTQLALCEIYESLEGD